MEVRLLFTIAAGAVTMLVLLGVVLWVTSRK